MSNQNVSSVGLNQSYRVEQAGSTYLTAGEVIRIEQIARRSVYVVNDARGGCGTSFSLWQLSPSAGHARVVLSEVHP